MAELGPDAGICERLTHLRRAVFGERGRAAFARALGVSPSTYNYYEKGRPPPAQLLTRAAEVAGADLTWLLTGAGQAFGVPPAGAGDIQLSQQSRDALARLVSAAADGPQIAAARAGLAALLAQIERSLPQPKAAWEPRLAAPSTASIPIVGRTAAGVLAPWEQFFAGEGEPENLERMLSRAEDQAARQREGDLRAADPHGESSRPADPSAVLTQLCAPTPDGVVEFLDLPGLRPIAPGTFGLRVDGDSMAPRILDGDIIVSHRDAAPQPGQTAIVRVRGRVGVTVKLWRPEGDAVHLIPINDARQPSVFPRSDILWACRVLWVVRL